MSHFTVLTILRKGTRKSLEDVLAPYDENLEVFTNKEELVGNIGEVNKIQADEYAFFGKSFPCIILSDR